MGQLTKKIFTVLGRKPRNTDIRPMTLAEKAKVKARH